MPRLSTSTDLGIARPLLNAERRAGRRSRHTVRNASHRAHESDARRRGAVPLSAMNRRAITVALVTNRATPLARRRRTRASPSGPAGPTVPSGPTSRSRRSAISAKVVGWSAIGIRASRRLTTTCQTSRYTPSSSRGKRCPPPRARARSRSFIRGPCIRRSRPKRNLVNPPQTGRRPRCESSGRDRKPHLTEPRA